MNLNQLEEYFEKVDLSKYDNTRLYDCALIVDAEKFVKIHISFLRGNPKNKRFIAYYNRLLKFREIIESKPKN